jgi:ketosteroid isomerase-like protein
MAAKARIQIRVAQVLRSGDDLALVYGDWSGHFTDPDGQRVEIAGQSVEVMRRQRDGSWRFAMDDPYARG